MFAEHFFELFAKLLSDWFEYICYTHRLAWRVKALGGGTGKQKAANEVHLQRNTLANHCGLTASAENSHHQCTDATPAYIETQGPRLNLGSKWVGEPDKHKLRLSPFAAGVVVGLFKTHSNLCQSYHDGETN